MIPILRRELLGALRTRSALAVQVAVALACALLVLVRWPSGEVADLTGARSLQVLRVVGYGLLTAVILIVPAFPATSLVREKVQGTLALLFNTPLTPLSIYAGKLAGVLGFTALLLAMTLPAAAACFALGGTTAQGGILALYAVLGVAVVQIATVALLVSSRAQSTDGALRATYGLVLAVCVLSLGPHALLQGGSAASRRCRPSWRSSARATSARTACPPARARWTATCCLRRSPAWSARPRRLPGSTTACSTAPARPVS